MQTAQIWKEVGPITTPQAPQKLAHSPLQVHCYATKSIISCPQAVMLSRITTSLRGRVIRCGPLVWKVEAKYEMPLTLSLARLKPTGHNVLLLVGGQATRSSNLPTTIAST